MVALCHGMVRTQTGDRTRSYRARFIHVDCGIRYSGKLLPLPEAVLNERRSLALDLIIGRVGWDHPLSGILRAMAWKTRS